MKKTLRIAAVGDLHCTRKSDGAYRRLFSRASDHADVLLLCGDLTDYGLPEEAEILAREITTSLTIPAVAVLGNHDYESGKEDEVRRILLQAGVVVLDGDACEIHGVGFAGVKGFCGGFRERLVEPWGEQVLKQFVLGSVDEALKLEKALARCSTSTRVVLLHYAPIAQTLEGEPPEIHAFLGTSRLEAPLDTHTPHVVFHGHAHYGSLEGRTAGGVPVYNVAMPLLRRSLSVEEPFRVIEVPIGTSEQDAPPPTKAVRGGPSLAAP